MGPCRNRPRSERAGHRVAPRTGRAIPAAGGDRRRARGRRGRRPDGLARDRAAVCVACPRCAVAGRRAQPSGRRGHGGWAGRRPRPCWNRWNDPAHWPATTCCRPPSATCCDGSADAPKLRRTTVPPSIWRPRMPSAGSSLAGSRRSPASDERPGRAKAGPSPRVALNAGHPLETATHAPTCPAVVVSEALATARHNQTTGP